MQRAKPKSASRRGFHAIALGLVMIVMVAACAKNHEANTSAPPDQTAPAATPPVAAAPPPSDGSAPAAPADAAPRPEQAAPPETTAAEPPRPEPDAAAPPPVVRPSPRPPIEADEAAPDRGPASEPPPAAGPAAPERTPPPSPGPTEAPAVIDSVASQLAQRPVSYNKPSELTFGRPTTVQVMINTAGANLSGEFSNLPGAVTTTPILVSHEMSAVLTGPAEQVKVALRPGIPPWQRLTTAGNPTWIWDVTALAPGSTRLDLTILARVKTADGAAEQTIRTFHDTLPVRMSWLDAAKWWISQVDPVWKWTTGVVATLGAAFVWWRTNVARKKKRG